MIEVYENVLSEGVRNSLIQYIENGGDGNISYSSMGGKKVFAKTNLPFDCDETGQIISLVKEIAKDYLSKYDPYGMTPDTIKHEMIKIKKYDVCEGCFPLHIDNNTKENLTRYLAFLFYLNDTDAGTRFHLYNDTVDVPCVGGNVLVFPPLWIFPHEGLTPTTNSKYIMSVYLHFTGEQYPYGYERTTS